MRAFVVCAAALSIACGGGPTASEGEVGGVELDAQDGLLEVSSSAGDTFATLYLSNREQLCFWAEKTANLNGTRLLSIALGIVAPNGNLVAPDTAGRYEIAPQSGPKVGLKLADAAFLDIDACANAEGAVATGGYVQLDHVSRDTGNVQLLRGTFDLTFQGPPPGHLTGRFSIEPCPQGVLVVRDVCHLH
jgi:hypothetical protein